MIAADKPWRFFEPCRDAADLFARDVEQVIELIGRLLRRYAFTPQNEADLQAQVSDALVAVGLDVDREVIAERGRYDLLVRSLGASIVLELKVTGSAPAVERQAQRYALTAGIDAVLVVTTSNRLGHELTRPGLPATLGGKPFSVIVLRSF